ncbi:9818_t:CDS:2, partial [Rhizophagus irregularis]
SLTFPDQYHVVNNYNDIIEERENTSLLQKSLDINDDLILDDILNNISNYENSSILQDQSSIKSSIVDLLIQTQSRNSFDSTFKNNINHMIVDELIAVIIKKHDAGHTFDQIQELINQKILQLNQITNNLTKANWNE